MTVVVEAAWMTLPDLPAGEMATLSRVGFEDALPRHLVPPDGVLQLGPLPPGAYMLELDGELQELSLQPGRATSR